jgi:hypothetical protein
VRPDPSLLRCLLCNCEYREYGAEELARQDSDNSFLIFRLVSRLDLMAGGGQSDSMFPIYRYTALPYNDMVFIESSLFERFLPRYLSDEEFGRLQMALRNEPALGVVIPGSGGIRKLRWRRQGTGKRGGVRVIYYLNRPHEIWLLTIYAKGEAETIPVHILRAIKREMENAPAKKS